MNSIEKFNLLAQETGLEKRSDRQYVIAHGEMIVTRVALHDNDETVVTILPIYLVAGVSEEHRTTIFKTLLYINSVTLIKKSYYLAVDDYGYVSLIGHCRLDEQSVESLSDQLAHFNYEALQASIVIEEILSK